MSGPSPRRTARSLSLSLASLFPFHQPVTVDHRHPRDREGESTVDRVYVARGRAPPEAEGPAAAILTGPERAVAAGSAVKQHEGGKAKATHRHRPTTTARESPPTRGPAMCLPGSFRSRRHGAHEGRGALPVAVGVGPRPSSDGPRILRVHQSTQTGYGSCEPQQQCRGVKRGAFFFRRT